MNKMLSSVKDIYKVADAILLVVLIFVIVEYLFQLYDTAVETTNIYICQLLIAYVISTAVVIKKYGALHILSLVFITTFVFGISGIVVSIFGNSEYDFRELHSLVDERFSEPILQKTILIYTFYIIIAYFLSKKWCDKDNKTISNTKISRDGKLYKIGKWCVLILLPIAVYYNYLMYTLGGGRDAIFIYGSNEALGMPFYVRLGKVFFDVGYYIIIASFPSKKQFFRMSLIYCIPLTLVLSYGERGDVAAVLLFIMWFAYMVYNYKFSYKFLFLVAVIFVIVFQIIAFARVGETVQSYSLMSLVSLFFFSQSISFNLLPLYMIYENQLPSHWYPYFLDSVIGGILPVSGQNLQTLEVRSSLTHHLCYTLNPEYYLAGHSLGTSNIAEFYEFGLIGVAVGALFLVLFIHYLNIKMLSNRIWLFFAAYCFRLIILSPRGGLLPSIYDLFKLSAIAVVILVIFGYKSKIKKYAKS